jgi:hypothetical protein
MKKIFYVLIFLSFGFTAFPQEQEEKEAEFVCRYGFSFEVSRQQNWGYAKPIVSSVIPNASADAGGLKLNDIIEEIDDQSTEGQSYETIVYWLQNTPKSQINLSVSNLKESHKKVTLSKYCYQVNALLERDLASVYSFYSLENVQTRSFSCPFKTTTNIALTLIDYKTFGFPDVDVNNRELEETINASIRSALEQKGMVYAEKNPDLLIHTHYSYNKNLNYRKTENADKFPIVNRYNLNTRTSEDLPIYYNMLIHPNQAAFFLNLGIRLVDRKKSFGENLAVVWECEAKELIQSGSYTLNKYVEFHIPLMFMQYPYIKSAEEVEYFYSRSKYNYTGINYNMDNLKEIIDIDYGSPAAKAGIKIGDVVEKINGISFSNNPKSADKSYKQFILKTMPMRDTKTQFTNATGFTKCMYWDKFKYSQIYDEFKKEEFTTAFSYLFYFEPYINLSGTNIVTFSIKRGRERLEVKVQPIIVGEELFESR